MKIRCIFSSLVVAMCLQILLSWEGKHVFADDKSKGNDIVVDANGDSQNTISPALNAIFSLLEQSSTDLPQEISLSSIAQDYRLELEEIIIKYMSIRIDREGFLLTDPDSANKIRNVLFIKLNEKIYIVAPDKLYLCADFKDMRSGEDIDLDFEFSAETKVLNIKSHTIHRVGGQDRFVYNLLGEQVELVPAEEMSLEEYKRNFPLEYSKLPGLTETDSREIQENP